MKVKKAGIVTAGVNTIDLSEFNFTSELDYSVRLHTNAYSTTGGTGTGQWGYGWGLGAYVSERTATSVKIAVSTGITASYEILA